MGEDEQEESKVMGGCIGEALPPAASPEDVSSLPECGVEGETLRYTTGVGKES
jgi:hypothetical protein